MTICVVLLPNPGACPVNLLLGLPTQQTSITARPHMVTLSVAHQSVFAGAGINAPIALCSFPDHPGSFQPFQLPGLTYSSRTHLKRAESLRHRRSASVCSMVRNQFGNLTSIFAANPSGQILLPFRMWFPPIPSFDARHFLFPYSSPLDNLPDRRSRHIKLLGQELVRNSCIADSSQSSESHSRYVFKYWQCSCPFLQCLPSPIFWPSVPQSNREEPRQFPPL